MSIHAKDLSRSVYLRARGREADYARLPPHPLVKRYIARPLLRAHLTPMIAQASHAVPVLAGQPAVERVFDHDARSFWGFWRQGEEDAACPGGLIALLLLSAGGVAQLHAGRLDFHDPPHEALVAFGETPSGIYIWLMYAPGRISGALFSLFEEMNKAPFAAADIYWRPVTPAGRRLTRPFGFELVGSATSVTNLYKIARGGPSGPAESPAAGPAASATAPPPGRRAHDISVAVARSIDDIMRAVAIRAVVYMAEQVCPYDEEFDGNDFCATHVVADVDGEPAACIRLRFFGDFAKIERVAVRKEFRTSRVVFRLINFTLALCRRKGFRRVYGHVQERLMDFWTGFGAQLIADRPKFAFSDNLYVEMLIELEPGTDKIGIGSDPHLVNRPEGDWDRPGVLERPTQHPAAPGPR